MAENNKKYNPEKIKILSLFDNTRGDALTKEERQSIIQGAMSVLLDPDETLGDFGLLLSRFEETCVALERVISDIWDIVGECGDSGDTNKLSRIETRLLDYKIEAYDGPE